MTGPDRITHFIRGRTVPRIMEWDDSPAMCIMCLAEPRGFAGWTALVGLDKCKRVAQAHVYAEDRS